MAETLEFDPAAEGTGSPLTVSSGSYGLVAHQYPTPPVSAQWAFSVDTEGARLGSQRHDNRSISLTIDCASSTALAALQAKVAKLYREGGTLKRTLPNGWTVIFDVLTVDNYEPSFDHAFDMGDISTVPITLTCKPYGRGTEQDLGDNVETSLPALVFTEATIPGDMPALGRLVIDSDDPGVQHPFLAWGLRSRYYSSASTAAVYFEAESYVSGVSGTSTAAGTAPASGGASNVARHTNLGTTDTAANTRRVFISLGSTASPMTHIGTFRVFARVYVPSANAGAASVRFNWRPIGTAPEVANEAVTPLEDAWTLVDLGSISIPKVKAGTQGWTGYISAWSTVAGDDIDIDCVVLVPVDEGWGQTPGDVAEPAFFESGSVEIRHDAALRKSVSGNLWPGLPGYVGDYLLVPASGAEARTSQIVVVVADSEVSTSCYAWTTIPDVSARLYVTPRYLVIPQP